MNLGGKRTLKLPPQLGYGMRGAGCRGGIHILISQQYTHNQNQWNLTMLQWLGSCVIPPDSVLLFDVEFIGKGWKSQPLGTAQHCGLLFFEITNTMM